MTIYEHVKVHDLYMIYVKEKGCAEGAEIFRIMYFTSNFQRKNFGPPSLTVKKFWSPLRPTEKKLGPPWTTSKNSGPPHKQTAPPSREKMIAPLSILTNT